MKNVYIYTLSDQSGIKYVGKTVNIKIRLYRHIYDAVYYNKSTKKNNWIKSLLNKNEKPILEILDVVPKEEWVFWEKYWILQLQSWGIVLKNETCGGEGIEMTDEIKNKISVANKGRHVIKRPESIYIVDKVIQYDIHGKFIKEWDSMKMAERVLNIKNIFHVVYKIRNTAGGYIWRFKKDGLNLFDLLNITNNRKKVANKKIIQMTLDGQIIKEWDSVRQIRKIYQHIGSVLRGTRKTAGGCLWKYKVETNK